MNTYFLNPSYFNAERFHIFLDILKVNKVIDLTDLTNRNHQISTLCQSLIIYDRKNTDINVAKQQAVYIFNEPMCKAIIDKGRLTGNFEVNDVYKESYAFNPIYNLENSNDDNVLILIEENFICKDFVKYSFSLLAKYAEYYKFENRICFIRFYKLLEGAAMFNQRMKVFTDLKRTYNDGPRLSQNEECKHGIYSSYPKNRNNDICWLCNRPRISVTNECKIEKIFKNNLYNPLLSYINLKTRKLYEKTKYMNGLHKFFLTDEGFNKFADIVIERFNLRVKRLNKNNEYFESEAPTSYGICSEYSYIQNNGGDWISY